MTLKTLHECSSLGVKNDLELFTLPITQFSHLGSEWVEYHPTSLKPQESDTVEFNVPNSGLNYLDPSCLYLQIKAKIVRASDGANTEVIKRTPPSYTLSGTPPTDIKREAAKLSAGDKVYPCNNFGNSMLRYVDVYLNGFLVSNHEVYPYRSYLEVMLNSTRAMRKTYWTMGFAMVEPGQTLDFENDRGINKLYSLAEGSREFNLETPLFTDIGDTKMLLLPGVDLRIVIRQSSDSFRLITANDEERQYKLKIMDFKLRVRFVQVSDHVRLSHENALKKTPAKYPLRGVELRFYTLPIGSPDILLENLCPKRVPNKITILFVSTEAFYGTFKTNPLKFVNLNMRKSSLFVGTHERREVFDFDKKQFASAFVNFIRAVSDKHVEISHELYEKELFMLHYILTPDGCADNFSPIQVENVRLQIELKEPLTQSYTCLIVTETPRILEIYKDRTLKLKDG